MTHTMRQRRLQQNIDLATCTPRESNFKIDLVNMGNEANTEALFKSALEAAADRWSKVIVGDLPNLRARSVPDLFNGAFDTPYTAAVDDVVIGYDVSSTIDGPGRTLGQAGPVYVRSSGTESSTISGVMQFDKTDLDAMSEDDVRVIILHEMGHVLGLVGVHGGCAASCNPNSFVRSTYECERANAEFSVLRPGRTLFLENNGGPGTACGHWDESSFRSDQSSELMTGFFEANLWQPLSLVTVAALDDIGGYEVDYCGADIWPATADTQNRHDVLKPSGAISTEDGVVSVDPIKMTNDAVTINGEPILEATLSPATSPDAAMTSASQSASTMFVVALLLSWFLMRR